MGLFKKVGEQVIDCRMACRLYQRSSKVKDHCDGLELGTRAGVCPRSNYLNNQYSPFPMGSKLEDWRQRNQG